MKNLLTTLVLLSLMVMAHGQNQEQKSIASPYDKGHSRLNPMPPICRDVSKNKTIDYGAFRILYALNATKISDPKTYDDLQRLEIGSEYSKYYSQFVFQRDSAITSDLINFNELNKTNEELSEDGVQVSMIIDGKFQGWSPYLFSEIFKDLSKNKLTEYCRMPEGCSKYNSQYLEDLPVQDWKIDSKTQIIAGYLCQKATCDFRGRSYTAWFAVDIPISNGPWKFGGLPGLILKVYDDKEEYVFECVSIENFKEKHPITLLDTYKTYQKMERKSLNELLKRIQENYYQLSGLTPRKGEVFPALNSYNPLERE